MIVAHLIAAIRRSLRKQNPRVTITLDVFSPDDRRAVVLTIVEG